MTLEELLKKNAAVKAAREHMVAAEEQKVEPMIENVAVEQPVMEEIRVDEEVKAEESKREDEEAVAEKPKKKGKKPANREYMVVEDESVEPADADHE